MWVVTVDYANRLLYEGTPITGTKLRSLAEILASFTHVIGEWRLSFTNHSSHRYKATTSAKRQQYASFFPFIMLSDSAQLLLAD